MIKFKKKKFRKYLWDNVIFFCKERFFWYIYFGDGEWEGDDSCDKLLKYCCNVFDDIE